MTGRELIAKLNEVPEMLDREVVIFRPGLYRTVDGIVGANIPTEGRKRADVMIIAQGSIVGTAAR